MPIGKRLWCFSRGTIRYWIDNQDKVLNKEYYDYNKKDKSIEVNNSRNKR
jgi:hypothetical protein